MSLWAVDCVVTVSDFETYKNKKTEDTKTQKSLILSQANWL